MTTDGTTTNTNGLLNKLSVNDRERLGEALRRLLTSGSILGLLKLHWEHQDRTVQAVPQSSGFLLRLKLDATLVLLTLWYEFDTAVRDRGETPPVRLTAQQLNDSLTAKFEPLRKHLPSQTRLREILALAQRKNLVHITPDIVLERSQIEILPTLKRVIPFQGIEEWNKNAERYLASAKEPVETDLDDNDKAE